MRIWGVNAAVYFVCITAVAAISQDRSVKVITTGPPVSLTEQLNQHHVGLNRADLVNALQSSDGQVRYLAALRLAEEKDMRAVPAIEQALTTENVPETRINIAIALVQLGQEKGILELTASCNNPELPGYFRARAMIYMLPLGNKTCFSAALELLGTDPDSRDQVLSLLPRYPHASKEESDEVLEATTKCLTDESAAIRIQASITLRTLGNPAAISYLQSAIAAEKGDAVRSQMRDSLEHLESKQNR